MAAEISTPIMTPASFATTSVILSTFAPLSECLTDDRGSATDSQFPRLTLGDVHRRPKGIQLGYLLVYGRCVLVYHFLLPTLHYTRRIERCQVDGTSGFGQLEF